MRKTIIIFFLAIGFKFYAQEPTLKDATDFLKEKIETMCTQSTSVFYVKTDGCILNIEEKIDTTLANFYHLDLSEITDKTYYTPKEKFGKTRITFKGPGNYMISYFSLEGVPFETKTANQVVLPFKTKGIDRIKFVNRIDKAAMRARELCKSKF